MGFTNTTYRQTVDNLVTAQQDRLNNPYYKFSDKKPTVVTYWNINDKKTTLDQGTRSNYSQLGTKSPLRYNKINNFVLYGIPQFSVNMQLGEYGVESNSIEGEALILPNTIIPFNDDYFTISYLKNPYIFRINNVSIDTLENGSNFYVVQFHLDNTIDNYVNYLNTVNLADIYDFNIENVGTNLTPILKDSTFKIISDLSHIYDVFRRYYENLFYRENIQTFVYGYLDMYIYDPYLLEFLIRTGIFAVEDDFYMYLSQAVHKSHTFDIEYNKSIFMNIENKDPQLNTNSCYPVPVHDPNSLLMHRMEDYWELSINLHHRYLDPINWLDNRLFDKICENSLYDENDDMSPHLYRNIIIKYLNNDISDFTLTDKEFNSLVRLRLKYCKDLFYELPILMYIMRQYMLYLQSNGNTATSTDVAKKYLEDCFSVGK